ncbi:hypothetical protein B0H16DRAFT_1440002 [Mycena metata]|uniref:MYND-type domain-containing protein n=1 Tax=Mycena metata TaxID=1033252 RepID=A0AAD7M6M9_9AGAR|nr:hypothetical protein B0H16DRAFT_1440002 [Mycena metata]
MTPTKCASCGLAASARCVGCMDAPEYKPRDAVDVVYCSTKCQQGHWAIHKARCTNLKKRRRLLRVATILRAALLAYREALFDIPLAKIELRGGVLHLYRDPSPDISIRRFPFDLTANVAHKEAALTHNQCTLARSLLGPLARKLLAGVASSVENLDLKIGKPLVPTKLVERDPSLDFGEGPHTVLKVGMSTASVDEAWIIDPAGTQYGFRDVLVPFERYLADKRCTGISQPTPYTANETTDLVVYEALFADYMMVRSLKDAHDRQKEGRLHFAAFVNDRVGNGKEFFGSTKDLDGSAAEFQRKFDKWLGELKAYMEK